MTARVRGGIERLLLVVLGVALEWASMPPGPVPALAFAADAPFLWLLWHRGGERWKRWALLYGLARFAFGLRWLWEIGAVQGIGAPVVLAPVQLLYGLAIRMAVRRRVPFLLVVPVAAVLEEWLRTVWMGGMPWPTRSLALTAWPPLLAFSAQFGAYGLSFLAALSSAWVSGLPAAFRAGPNRRYFAETLAIRGALVAASVGVAILVGGRRVDEVTDRQDGVAMVHTAPLLAIQGNVPQSLKHSGKQDDENDVFSRHERLTLEALAAHPDALAVLWPETMIPWPFLDAALASRPEFHDDWENEYHVMRRLRDMLPRGSHARFLIGVNYYFVGEKGPQARLVDHDTKDSVFYVDAEAVPDEIPVPDPANPRWRPPWEIGRHDKVILVPGGEYTPLGGLIPALRKFKEDMSSIPELTPGDPDQEPFLLDIRPPERMLGETANREVRAGTVICYEIAFPARCRSWRERGATVLLNSGNYGWFGDSGMPAQLLALCRLRAAELGVTVVVAGNTGPTAIVDPVGRVRPDERVERDGRTQFVEGWCSGRLWSDARGTLYASWGDVPWAVLGALLLLLGVVRGRRLGAPPRNAAVPAEAPAEGPGEPRRPASEGTPGDATDRPGSG